MNKSIDSLDDLYIVDSGKENSRIPILVTLKQIKGQEPQLLVWNMKSGELIKTIDTRHKAAVTGIQKTLDFKLITVSKDAAINIYYWLI